MRRYDEFCPVATAAEVCVERWTPLALRDRSCGSYRFAALRRGVLSMSRPLLRRIIQHLSERGSAGFGAGLPRRISTWAC